MFYETIDMHYILLLIHSFLRWAVLLSLCIAISVSLRGFISGARFTPTVNAMRHWTATIAHIQLVVGIVLYSQSAVVKYFFSGLRDTFSSWFFSVIHIALMLFAIVVITIGSAIAKRTPRDRDKYRHMLLWYTLALIAILIAIPWPFSPLAQRPLFRPF